MKYKYLILGAGPAGLAFANSLKQHGETSFLVLEKEQEAGGLCRSTTVDGAPFDIGGGHFLDVRRPKVNRFLFGFMPEEEWNVFTRNSKIEIDTQLIDHPIEANIWQFDKEKQLQYLLSIAGAGCQTGTPKPDKFVDWIYWKLGDRIAEDYMLPYNRKMFGDNLNDLGTYWLDKLPDVSLEDTLRSCLFLQAFGKQPGHAQFYYPKHYGYGELWLRMSHAIADHIVYKSQVAAINFDEREVTTIHGVSYSADSIISTIPWNDVETLTGMPELLRDKVKSLKHTAINITYFPDNLPTEAHWIYYPSADVQHHRALLRHNFCPGSRGYWTETRGEGIPYAYPLNTIDKPQIMDELLTWTQSKQVFGLGRWGEHQHYNSDTTVELALDLAEKCLADSTSPQGRQR